MNQICSVCLAKGKNVDMNPSYEMGTAKVTLVVWTCTKCNHTIIIPAEKTENKKSKE